MPAPYKVAITIPLFKSSENKTIIDIIQAKKELADLTIQQGERWIGEYSNNELKKIFELQV